MGDESSRKRLPRRRLLGGVLTVGIAAGSVGVGAWALAEPVAARSSISASTEHPDLTLAGDTEYTLDNVAPNSGEQGTLDVTLNVESSNAKRLAIDVANSEHEDGDGDLSTDDSGPESDTASTTADGFASHFAVTTLEYERRNGRSVDLLDDLDTDGAVDLAGLAAATEEEGTLDRLQPPKTQKPTRFRMTVEVGDFGNDFQGDVLVTDVVFGLVPKGNPSNGRGRR